MAAIDVRPLVLEVGTNAASKSRTLSLRVEGAEERFVLRARDGADRDDWLDALAAAQAAAGDGRRSSGTASSVSLKIATGPPRQSRGTLDSPRETSLRTRGSSLGIRGGHSSADATRGGSSADAIDLRDSSEATPPPPDGPPPQTACSCAFC